MSQLVLFPPHRAALPLDAYLASALTGLSGDQRNLVFQISDAISVICKDVGIELYEPRKKTDPVHHSDISDMEVFQTDRERVLNSDLVIHLCHFPSTGSGEELDFAFNALVPIILISHGESRVSRMISGIPCLKVLITYSEPEEMRAELRDRLIEMRPILEERKLAFGRYDANVVGDNIRRLREDRSLTREEIAHTTKHLTVDTLRYIEESTDKTGNPSLLQLRTLAAVLNTTVADLVEPDLSERVIGMLSEWMSGRQAARFTGISDKDRNRILRRVLLRLIDSLENDA
jgi:transcriptional regulator with XRE-family HTH domain